MDGTGNLVLVARRMHVNCAWPRLTIASVPAKLARKG